MDVNGSGLIATAIQPLLDPRLPGHIYARGVSNSLESDESQYVRDIATLHTEMIRATGSFWYVSSIAADNPHTRYGAHKLQCEALVRDQGGDVIRLTNTVGNGGHPNQLIPSLVRQIKDGSVIVQHGATRDIIDVEDAARGILRIAQNVPSGRVWYLGSGVSTSVTLLVDEICRLLDVEAVVKLVAGGTIQRVSMAEPFDADYPFRVLGKYIR